MNNRARNLMVWLVILLIVFFTGDYFAWWCNKIKQYTQPEVKVMEPGTYWDGPYLDWRAATATIVMPYWNDYVKQSGPGWFKIPLSDFEGGTNWQVYDVGGEKYLVARIAAELESKAKKSKTVIIEFKEDK